MLGTKIFLLRLQHMHPETMCDVMVATAFI